MRLTFVKKLIKLIKEMDVEEVEIRRFGTSIRIRQNSLKNGGGQSAKSEKEQFGKSSVENKTDMSKETEETKRKDGVAAIKCPMVGTFYRAPSPDAPPYVEIGDHVREGQIVCIVEAMKIMNEIESDVRGTIIDVAAKNEDPVEFNQELFLVKSE